MPDTPSSAGAMVEEDGGDVGFTTFDYGCTVCLPDFVDGKPVRQRIEPRGKYMCCVKCGGSYGEVPAGAQAAGDAQPYLDSIDRTLLERAARTGSAAAQEKLASGPQTASAGAGSVDTLLSEAAAAYVRENAVVQIGDLVTTTWGSWKKPGRVRITHIGAELVCRWNGKDDWVVGFEMDYCGQRVRADGSVPDKANHLSLTNLVADDGREWKLRLEPGKQFPGFNHAGLAWGTFRTQRTSGAAISATEATRG